MIVSSKHTLKYVLERKAPCRGNVISESELCSRGFE